MDDAADLRVALSTLLTRVHAEAADPRVYVALGPSMAHVAPLPHLRTIDDAVAVAGIVQETPHMFFVAPPPRPRSGHPARAPRGEWWAMLVDTSLEETLHESFAAAHVRLEGLVPTVSLFARRHEGQGFVLEDGDSIVEAQCEDGVLRAVIRHQSRPADIPPPQLGAPDCNLILADAWAAAMYEGSGAPMISGVGGSGERRSYTTRVAATAVLLSVAAMAIVPVAVSLASVRRYALADASQSHSYSAALALHQDVAALTDVLDDLDAFLRNRVSVAAVMAELADAASGTTELERIVLRSPTELDVTALSDEVSAFLAALRASSTVQSAETVGGIDHDATEGVLRQRVNVRLRLASPVLAADGEP